MTQKNEKAQVVKSQEEKVNFIESHREFIPNHRIKAFDTWEIDRQYRELSVWVEMGGWKKMIQEQNKIENKVKTLFEKRKVTTQDVLRVIDFCKEWIDKEKEREMQIIDAEIQRLNELKKQMEEA